MSEGTTRTHQVNALLDDAEKNMLDTLAVKAGISRGLVIRQSLRARYAMQEHAMPTCADGGRCHCPHLHVQPPRVAG